MRIEEKLLFLNRGMHFFRKDAYFTTQRIGGKMYYVFIYDKKPKNKIRGYTNAINFKDALILGVLDRVFYRCDVKTRDISCYETLKGIPIHLRLTTQTTASMFYDWYYQVTLRLDWQSDKSEVDKPPKKVIEHVNNNFYTEDGREKMPEHFAKNPKMYILNAQDNNWR